MKIRTHISKALSLLTSAAIAVGCIPALELPAAAESSDTSQVSLSKNQKTYGDGWFWNGESLLIYGASFDVPENTAYFGNFNGFAAGDTIKVLVEGLNEITLADGAVFVDSDQIPLSVDGSSYMKVSGSGVLFSGADADYYGGVINAQGAVTLFDAPTLVIKGGQVLAPEGTVISDGGNQASSVGIKSANVKAKSFGAAEVSGLKSHLEFPEGCGEIANLNLDTCTAYISGTGFTTNFDFKQSVVIFQDVSSTDAASLKVISDYGSHDTGKGGTVFCNEFLSDTRFSAGDYDVGVLSEGSHSGMYYDGSQALRVPAKSTITGANYITSPNRVVLVVGSVDSVTRLANINDASAAGMTRAPVTPVANNDAYVTDAVITAISTGKGGVTQYYAANGAISLYRVSLTNSSLFADGVETIRALLAERNTPSSFIAVGEEKGQILISPYKYCKYDFTGNVISEQYCGISCSSIGGRATGNGFGFDFDTVIDGKITEVLGKGAITSIQIRNGSYWCGKSSTRLTPSDNYPYGRVFVHPDAKDTTYIYSALSGTDKYYEYTQLPLNTDNKVYIGRQIYEPYINIVVSTAKSWMIDGAKITTVCAADFTALPGIAEKTSLRGVNGAAFKGGNTGVPAVLKLTFRKEFAGQFANVYKLADNRLVFLQCVKITADGTALISGVNAAGEYAVMVCEYSDLIGDINNDGVLNALDASAILRHITGIFEGVDILFADFNNDGTVNALDASAILKAIIE